MISMAAIPVAGRAGGHASSSRRAQAANALSSARSAAVSGGDAIAVALLVTGASDQRRRLRSAAEDIFFRCCSLALRGRFVCAGMPWRSSPYDARPLASDASLRAREPAVRAGQKLDALFLVPKAASCEFADAGTLKAATTSAWGSRPL